MGPLLICLCFIGIVNSQTMVNPEISAVGDSRVFGHDDETRNDEKNKFNITAPELELNIGGYLNPYARADLVIGRHGDHHTEIEELWATVEHGLPLAAGLRVGKYLLEFSRLNPVRSHAYSFIKRPLPHELFFGPDGLADIAIRPSFLLPTSEAYTEVMAALLKSDILAGHEHEGAEHADDSSRNHASKLAFWVEPLRH